MISSRVVIPAGIWVDLFSAVIILGRKVGLKILVSAVQVRLLASFYPLGPARFHDFLAGSGYNGRQEFLFLVFG
jgi:hypothetical protein